MLTVAEALSAILNEVGRFPSHRIALGDALGLVLAEDAVSDLDSPPFDKALMDGYAVRSSDLQSGVGPLRVIEEVLAGAVPQRHVGMGETTRIMTGAPIPAGADAVVQVEHSQLIQTNADHQFVQLETAPLTVGRNVLKRGASTQAGERVLPAGRQLRAQELGCMAELGCDQVAVYRSPRVAVLATGNELVPVGTRPGPGQIRNSNETMLVSQLRQMGAEPVPLGVARDEPDELRRLIETGLKSDMLLLSGGVSAGKLDLVPGVLAAAGVRQIFHKVQIKPGQPLWFGVCERPAEGGAGSQTGRCYVFGLPGNPVSSMVCCELFVKTAVRKLMGIEPAAQIPVRARLKVAHQGSGNRPTYHPAHLEFTSEGACVQTVPWVGSSDLSATVAANAMALFPAGDRLFEVDEVLDVFAW